MDDMFILATVTTSELHFTGRAGLVPTKERREQENNGRKMEKERERCRKEDNFTEGWGFEKCREEEPLHAGCHP